MSTISIFKRELTDSAIKVLLCCRKKRYNPIGILRSRMSSDQRTLAGQLVSFGYLERTIEGKDFDSVRYHITDLGLGAI